VKENRSTRIGLQRVIVIVCILLLGVVAAGAASSKKAPSAPAEGASKTASAPRSLPLLVDVGADQCIPCKMMAPILEELKKEYAGILDVKFVDVWKYPEEAEKYRVRGIPTQIFYDASGKELARHMGFMGKENILKGFEQLGIPLKKPSAR
jgi:thioredoxin 1